MRYRKLDAAGDMTFGNGIGAFYVDIPEAPAQAVMTRLRMEQGEWFLDAKAGTISLQTHVHSGVQSGASNTGTPVP